jgi:hypothetical protein
VRFKVQAQTSKAEAVCQALQDVVAPSRTLPEVAEALAVLEQSLTAEPEATIFDVASSEPWG